MAANPRYRNGHRRRQLRARLLAEGGTCPWPACPWPGQPFDPSLSVLPGQHTARCHRPDCTGCTPHPQQPVVDEIIPISQGGDPLARDNTRLLHRWCNGQRGDGRRPPATPPTPASALPWSTAW